MSRRLYLGRLPHDTRPEDIAKHFDGYGKIIDTRVMTGFGFVEFESSKDAEDVAQNFNGKPFLGQSIIVEFAKDATRRNGPESYRDDRRREPPRRRGGGVRITVTGISRDTSWQDLKDFGREAGAVTFADVDRDRPGNGILEFPNVEDAEYAIRTLDGRDLRGVSVRLYMDEGRDRRSPPPRRDRSRSPPRRREGERRRSRSPTSRRSPRRYEDRREDRGDREVKKEDRDYKREDRGDRERDRESRRDERDGDWGR